MLQKIQHDCKRHIREEDLGKVLHRLQIEKKLLGESGGKLTKHGCKICGSAIGNANTVV